jgi:hypothetical protein
MSFNSDDVKLAIQHLKDIRKQQMKQARTGLWVTLFLVLSILVSLVVFLYK